MLLLFSKLTIPSDWHQSLWSQGRVKVNRESKMGLSGSVSRAALALYPKKCNFYKLLYVTMERGQFMDTACISIIMHTDKIVQL